MPAIIDWTEAVYGKQALRDAWETRTRISVYPVGVLMDLRRLWWNIRVPSQRQYIRRRLRWFARSWRSRSYWNGFLAEVDYPPPGLNHSRCGKGWTRKRAARDLGYQLWKDNQP